MHAADPKWRSVRIHHHAATRGLLASSLNIICILPPTLDLDCRIYQITRCQIKGILLNNSMQYAKNIYRGLEMKFSEGNNNYYLSILC